MPEKLTGQPNVAVPAPALAIWSTVSAFAPVNETAPDALRVILRTVAAASTVISAASFTISSSAAVNAPAGAGDQFATVERLPLAPPIHV